MSLPERLGQRALGYGIEMANATALAIITRTHAAHAHVRATGNCFQYAAELSLVGLVRAPRAPTAQRELTKSQCDLRAEAH